jgi:GNAT superfamily N-acetyltransferase
MGTYCAERVLTIRAATVNDIPRILEMGHRFNESSEYRTILRVADGPMEVLARKLIPAGWLLLSEIDGETVGMIGFYVYPHFLTGEMIGGEIFWWMEPEHRGAGKALLKAAEDIARRCGAKQMQMIAPNERVGRLYQRLKYGYVESTYQKAI